MTIIRFNVNEKFESSEFNYYYPDYKEKFFRPTSVKSRKEVVDIFEKIDRNDWCIFVNSLDELGQSVKLILKYDSMETDGQFELTIHPNEPRLMADVNATFCVDVDKVIGKDLTKSYKRGHLNFCVAGIGFVREGIQTMFGNEGGHLVGTEKAMPFVASYESELFKKNAKLKPKPALSIPIKLSDRFHIPKEEQEAVKEAIIDGITFNIGLHIEGGSNSRIFKRSELVGSVCVELQQDTLIVAIDAAVNWEIDNWMKKYKDLSPFSVFVQNVYDSKGNPHYFGSRDENGYSQGINLGEVSMS